MAQVEKEVFEYAARHIHEAIEAGKFDYISKNTIRVWLHDGNNMEEGTYLVVEIKVGEK